MYLNLKVTLWARHRAGFFRIGRPGTGSQVAGLELNLYTGRKIPGFEALGQKFSSIGCTIDEIGRNFDVPQLSNFLTKFCLNQRNFDDS